MNCKKTKKEIETENTALRAEAKCLRQDVSIVLQRCRDAERQVIDLETGIKRLQESKGVTAEAITVYAPQAKKKKAFNFKKFFAIRSTRRNT